MPRNNWTRATPRSPRKRQSAAGRKGTFRPYQDLLAIVGGRSHPQVRSAAKEARQRLGAGVNLGGGYLRGSGFLVVLIRKFIHRSSRPYYLFFYYLSYYLYG